MSPPSVRRCLQWILTILAIVGVSLVPASVRASHVSTAPAVQLFEATAYQNVVDSSSGGDILILLRYELPIGTATSTDDWCLELNDTTGCDSTPANPTAPWSLSDGLVTMDYQTNVAGGAVLRSRVNIPRVSHGLGGIYFSPGHGLTYGDLDSQVCVSPSVTAYSTTTPACIAPVWAVDVTGNGLLDELATGIIGMVSDLEVAREVQLGSYVSLNRITQTGQVFAREAFPYLERIVPSAFQTGAEEAVPSFTPGTGESSLQAALDAAATPTRAFQALDIAAREYTGLSGPAVGTVFALGMGFVLAMMLYHVDRTHPELAGIGFFAPLMVGIYMRSPVVAVPFAFIVILLILTVGWYVRTTVP